jgi:hypothetical protein
MSAATNIGKVFLRTIKKVFTKKHRLYKIFNRNNIKLSYSCMPNLKQTISNHNRKLLTKSNPTATSRKCNCRDKTQCPLRGNCLASNLVYQAVVKTSYPNKPEETYIGLTENAFKTRYNNHLCSFRHSTKRTATELSNYIWKLKDQGIDYNIQWNVVGHAKAYNPSSKRCNLCLLEKLLIITKPSMSSLNKRTELISTCRHASKYILRTAIT